MFLAKHFVFIYKVCMFAACSNETRAKDKNNFNQYFDMEKKIRQKIELDAKGKEKLAKAFGVTTQNVRQALLFKRNSVQACRIREAALINGGSLVQIIDVTDEVKRAVKVLDSHGNVKAVIANDVVTL